MPRGSCGSPHGGEILEILGTPGLEPFPTGTFLGHEIPFLTYLDEQEDVLHVVILFIFLFDLRLVNA